jgi:hypothetical protein
MFLSLSVTFTHALIILLGLSSRCRLHNFFLKHSIFVAILTGCSVNFHIVVLSQQILNFSGSTYFTSGPSGRIGRPGNRPWGPCPPLCGRCGRHGRLLHSGFPERLIWPPDPLPRWTAGSWPDNQSGGGTGLGVSGTAVCG